MVRFMGKHIRDLNFFPSVPPTNDRHQFTNQLVSTRFFIVIFLLIIAILLSFLSSVTIDKILIVKQPTLQQYQQLYDQHSQTITCPCTRISVEHSIFLHINYTLHQACSSEFVTTAWFNYLERASREYSGSWSKNFRITSIFTFRALGSLCAAANDTLSNSLIRFFGEKYVTVTLTPSSLLESQLQSFVDQFRMSTINDFSLSLRVVRGSIQINALFSSLATNFYIWYDYDRSTPRLTGKIYGNCSCVFDSFCREPSGIYNGMNINPIYTVPGMYIGCFLVESLLQSTLECFYSDSCFNQLTGYISTTTLSNATILNATASSRYLPTTNVSDIVNQLMLETWNWTMMYDKYYAECEPYECRYTIKTRNDIIYIVTTLIGLIGGLVAALKIVVPQLVSFTRRKRTFQRTGKIKFFHSSVESQSYFISYRTAAYQ